MTQWCVLLEGFDQTPQSSTNTERLPFACRSTFLALSNRNITFSFTPRGMVSPHVFPCVINRSTCSGSLNAPRSRGVPPLRLTGDTGDGWSEFGLTRDTGDGWSEIGLIRDTGGGSSEFGLTGDTGDGWSEFGLTGDGWSKFGLTGDGWSKIGLTGDGWSNNERTGGTVSFHRGFNAFYVNCKLACVCVCACVPGYTYLLWSGCRWRFKLGTACCRTLAA